MNLFTNLEEQNKQIPLAEILRPKTLSEFLGQNQILSENNAMKNLLLSKRLFSLILWGPPGCGKTTLARLITKETQSDMIELSAVSSGVKDIKDAVERAKENLRAGIKTVLFIDEIHRYNKTQQDALLPHLEKGTLYLIGSTTENPSFQVNPALVSRSQVMMLKPLEDEAMLSIIRKGYKYLMEKYGKVELDKQIGEAIVNFASGDARIALNLVEYSYFSSDFNGQERSLSLEILEGLIQRKTIKYDMQEHYDIASAYQKSMRGSDPDAAIYWLAKMIAGGEDPRFIARRLVVCASEDVGNADPIAFVLAMNALKAVETLGLPEARIPLAQATIYVAKAPKSNEAICAIDSALNDILHKGKNYTVPAHLKDAHYKAASSYGFGIDYKYSHNHPNEAQTFLPDEMLDTKYL
ncbi:MAG: replication-associated recombination protein A [Candidatus Gastranaerophilales bacterium]|nr:replication-associated recombination protein A [Candidatus Gastranaerophilales bacterium]